MRPSTARHTIAPTLPTGSKSAANKHTNPKRKRGQLSPSLTLRAGVRRRTLLLLALHLHRLKNEHDLRLERRDALGVGLEDAIFQALGALDRQVEHGAFHVAQANQIAV